MLTLPNGYDKIMVSEKVVKGDQREVREREKKRVVSPEKREHQKNQKVS